ncbi:MAG: monooxygenase [Microbacterium sp. 71-36]|uniref:cytochrome P450 n=1 Tax=unclassified Microbacterium TaxID=2609290 RepID=UPI00092A77FD|nr:MULTISPECIES: cytochrome P450 [unclassified Microbacterium]MBN9210153.1 cytochrome P450 [Microbacterium sp.]OJV76052.1 MAG: monooxygenase [Microbacterium sp. 71-36]
MSRTAPVADWVSIPDLYRDPFPIYDRLRAEGGVHWVPSVGRYLITSYEAVHTTEFEQETFSANEEGSLQIRAMGHSMLRRDDPEHYPERKAWQPVLRPGVVKRVWTDVFERNAARYLDEMVAKGPGADVIWDFAAPYAAENLREILGFHNVHQEDLQRWSQTLIYATGNYADDPEVWAKGQRSFDEVDIALDEMLRWHADHPDHSLISTLLRIPDYEMPIEKIRANIKMTIGGGLNEPRDALGVAAWALLTHPEQRRAVEADPGLWPTVFDEAIRWIAPIGLYSRQVTRETELAGVALPAGAKLGICILSANRDETVWDEADRFDIRREVKPHLAFSKGVHVCLGAWVAKAEVATVGLPRLFERLRGVDLHPERPAVIGGWVFRGMLELPVTWDTSASLPLPPEAVAPRPTLRVAIVGAGPSGCFSAQAIRRAFPSAEIDVFDRMPVPYGLVRYGVAGDHQGTKSVARQFDRLFADGGVRFHGGVDFGPNGDVDLAGFRAAFDAVVLATGVHDDVPLEVDGADLPGVVGAGRITRALNGHPAEASDVPILGERVVVVGQGNVALDVVRLLSRTAADLDGSDIDDAVHARLAGRVRTLHVIGRSAPGNAKFDPVMLRELAGLDGVAHVVHGARIDAVEPGKDARVDAVRGLTDTEDARVRVHWWFGSRPTRIAGEDRVTAVVLDVDGDSVEIEADDVVTAIGFRGDARSLAEAGAHPDGRIEPGLYVAGWLRRGPRGTIPDQRTDSRTLARLLADDLSSGALRIGSPGIGALGDLSGAIDFGGWRRIDARETLAAPPGRVRAKLTSLDELFATAGDPSIVLPDVEAERIPGAADGGIALTILFGTESGNAELVAEDLARHLADRAHVEVRDLADLDPTEIDAGRSHLVVCSTYGDGELPTTVRETYRALVSDRPDLSRLRYGVLGLGDRSYTKTYSRGSELLDEALTACGAQRVGEYGRHDAGGPVEATEVAREWADGVVAEMLTRDAVVRRG